MSDKTLNYLYLSKNFRLCEFEDRETEEVKVDQELLFKLQLLRTRIGRPIYITSGYRTPERNRAVGGHPNSKHMRGRAADIVVPDISKRLVMEFARKVGFTNVLEYENTNHIHVDVGG